MIRLYKFLKGYYVVRLSGEHIQRVLNRAVGKQVYIWELKKTGENDMEFNVSRAGFEIIKDIAEEAAVCLEIIEYRGPDRVLKMLKKRWMFCYACITVTVCVLVSSLSLIHI